MIPRLSLVVEVGHCYRIYNSALHGTNSRLFVWKCEELVHKSLCQLGLA